LASYNVNKEYQDLSFAMMIRKLAPLLLRSYWQVHVQIVLWSVEVTLQYSNTIIAGDSNSITTECLCHDWSFFL
jgi:hypothetical protein